MVTLLLVPFIALQGAVIFETARRSLKVMRISHWLGKIVATILSYFGWISLTIAGYMLLGGDGGLMDGFGFILILCFTAMISTLVYLLIWLLWPFKGEREANEKLRIEPFV